MLSISEDEQNLQDIEVQDNNLESVDLDGKEIGEEEEDNLYEYYMKGNEDIDQKWKEKFQDRDCPPKRDPGSIIRLDKEKNYVYFANADKADCLMESVRGGNVVQSALIPDLYKILDNNKQIIALATLPHNSGDWIYGRVFVDRKTRREFALVAHCCLGHLMIENGGIPAELKTKFPDKKFMTLEETNKGFEMKDFLKE